jgi:NAD(P)-dependent dehydrogenase (short-subunit alcohol dehydrogenase family)
MKSLSPKSLSAAIHDAGHICLFGIGALLKQCYQQLVLSLGREPDFFCDNARTKWGAKFFGKKCLSPSELGELGSGTLVIITVRNYEGICTQLYGMGIKDVFICCYDRCYNFIRAIKKADPDQSEDCPNPALPSLRGKWTLVTGASRGVGRQIALGMAELGSNIIAHSRSVAHVEELAARCSAFDVRILPVAAELSNLAEVEAMLSQLETLAPQIDIVFNNAAASPPCPSGFYSMPARDFLTCFTINTIAPMRICQRLIPPMIRRGYGRVVNITSSIQKTPDAMPYACSKAALDKFVHDLAPSLQGTGVVLSLVDPGWMKTDMGGAGAPYEVESVVPGALLGTLFDGDLNGCCINAQDYAGLSLPAAMKKARFCCGIED